MEAFLDTLTDASKREDSYRLLEIFRAVTGEEPRIWGGNIIGYGQYRYKYESGREGDWFKAGFSPRKQNLTLYLTAYQFDKHTDLLEKLGKHKLGKGCLYINRLKDVDQEVLIELLTRLTCSR